MKRKIPHLFAVIPLLITLAVILAAPVFAENDPAMLAEAAETEIAVENAPLISERLIAFLNEYTNELLSALTFLGSLLVAFFYKKGILPLLRAGLSALNDTAGKAEQITEHFTQKAEEELAAIKESTLPLAALVQNTEECIRTMQKALEESEKAQKETRRILAAETELFYELLTSANLPHAQKESMAKTFYSLREDLEELSP